MIFKLAEAGLERESRDFRRGMFVATGVPLSPFSLREGPSRLDVEQGTPSWFNWAPGEFWEFWDSPLNLATSSFFQLRSQGSLRCCPPPVEVFEAGHVPWRLLLGALEDVGISCRLLLAGSFEVRDVPTLEALEDGGIEGMATVVM